MTKEATSKGQQTIKDWNKRYRKGKSENHNSLLRNPEVLFQSFGFDASIHRALTSIGLDPEKSRVLDVGCGKGESMVPLIRSGFEPSNSSRHRHS